MSKVKIEKELTKVREQLDSLRKKETHLEQELKLAENAEKQSILEKHHISVEDLLEMIRLKKEEEKRLLIASKEEKNLLKNNEMGDSNNE